MGSLLSSYVADEASSIPLDTYYRGDEKYDVDGYQLLLINSRAVGGRNQIPDPQIQCSGRG